MRRILASAAVLFAVGAFLVLTLGSSSQSSGATYRIELQNAFGLVNGGDFKVAGVKVGKVESIDLCKFDSGSHCKNALDASVSVSATTRGFSQFHSDAFCQSRPQSLIGEYFLDCDPGTTGSVLPPGSTIQVQNTQSTIPADLVQNIQRLPFRERFTIIINELGAAVAARSMDIQSALRRADPALAQTDNLLALLAHDARTIRDLNASADQVITALAINNQKVQRFIVEANNAAQDSASPQANHNCGTSIAASCIEAGWNKFPGFLEQLRPTLFRLGQASDAQDPVFTNLNEAASNLTIFFHRLVPFSNESAVSLACGENEPACPNGGASLGTASKVGKPAVQAAEPLVATLRSATGPTGCDQQSNRILTCLPELAQNLAITLHAIDSRGKINYGNGLVGGGPVELDRRSPAGGDCRARRGCGYTGLEGLLMYAFNITLAVNTFNTWGHELAVDAFTNNTCSPYATPQTIANNIASYRRTGGNLNADNPNNPRTCYAFLGPNQQAVNETDPTWSPQTRSSANPSRCVPDPGGYPVQGYGTHYYGPRTRACRLGPSVSVAADTGSAAAKTTASTHRAARGSPGTGSSASSSPNQIVSQAGGTAQSTGATSGGAASGGNTQPLLNYLLAP